MVGAAGEGVGGAAVAVWVRRGGFSDACAQRGGSCVLGTQERMQYAVLKCS